MVLGADTISFFCLWISVFLVLLAEAKGKGEKERYTHLHAGCQRIARRDKKVFLSDPYKEIEENNRMGKTRDLFREKEMATHSSILAWRIPWTEKPGGLQPMGSQT